MPSANSQRSTKKVHGIVWLIHLVLPDDIESRWARAAYFLIIFYVVILTLGLVLAAAPAALCLLLLGAVNAPEWIRGVSAGFFVLLLLAWLLVSLWTGLKWIRTGSSYQRELDGK